MAPVLEFRDLGKSFGATRAVDGVNLTVDRGELVGIIGRSGAGKSTLLRLINRLCDTDEGEILCDGVNVGRLKGKALRAWRRRSAMVFQQFNLAPRLDVVTNVLVGALAERDLFSMLAKQFPREVRARAVAELHALGMAGAALQRAGTLSGGQQQRVAIARAMMQNPDYVLADEPIASLDPINAELVMNGLLRANRERGVTVIVNLHSLDVAKRYCTRIVGMSAGAIVFDGPVASLTQSVAEQIYGSGLTPAASDFIAETAAA